MTVDPQGDVGREAIDSLGGYAYQIYRSALAWLDLSESEFLYVEVAEDFAVAAKDALMAVQVKETKNNVTINSNDIVTTIDGFVTLMEKNPSLEVRIVHLTTSVITKEQSRSSRIGQTPLLESWKALSRAGDVAPLQEILAESKLADKTKKYIESLDEKRFRTDFLQRINFECGALNVEHVYRLLLSKLSALIIARGGNHSQSEGCLSNILIFLLKLSTQKDDRKTDRARLEEFIEKATHISINKSVFEKQLMSQGALTTAFGVNSSISADQQLVGRVHSVNKIPFPTVIANRQGQVDRINSALGQFGLSWIYGVSGVGKTLSAKLATKTSKDNWNILNLRGLDKDQAAQKIIYAAEMLSQLKTGGLILDDLDNLTAPSVSDAVLYLYFVCENYRLPLIVTAFQPPSAEFLHLVGLPNKFVVRISEFNKEDIEEILNGKGVHHPQNWVNYIHLVSGGGHPQLAIAAIQSMESNQWDVEELKTLGSLLIGNQAVELVRTSTRQRLYQELPDQDKRLLERLSLKLGSFDRKLVLSIAEVDPYISDAGYILDRHTGSWIDQQADDLFSLSPLLSGLAEKNLSENQKTKVHHSIADLILDDRSLNPIDADSALISAWCGHNTEVIIKLCLAVIQADRDELEMIAPHMSMLRVFRTDKVAYQENTFVSAIFRGAQLILLAHSTENQERFLEVLKCFESEVKLLFDDEQICSTRMMIMTKVLTSEAKFGEVPQFWLYLPKLEEWQRQLFSDVSGTKSLPQEESLPLVGFIFFNQVRQLKNIATLNRVFEYLDLCKPEFREKLLRPAFRDDFDVDLIFAGAWLSEHKESTINPGLHEPVFSALESYARNWLRNDIAVVARKYRALIIDEYAEDKNQAIVLLDEGMDLYGHENYELIRAKAKVYYRSKDHKNSENLSRIIIESDAPLSSTEKAFLGREAGISAEHQGDFAAARKYYLYGSKSASACLGDEMRPMEIGLLADAAIASWHDGDQYTCIRDMSQVLSRLHELNVDTSLRSAHCQAVSRHVVLWLLGEASGKEMIIENGEMAQIIPGVVSNPEPHEGVKEFAERRPMELAWYMLAAVENYSGLDAGITKELQERLPSGPIVEGKIVLTSAVRHKALNSLDVDLFVSSLMETLAEFSYYKKIKEENRAFNPLKPTFGDYPAPSSEDVVGFQKLAKGYTLVFSVRCVFESKQEELPALIKRLDNTDKLDFGKEFLSCLSSKRDSQDYYCSLATLVYQFSEPSSCGAVLPPLAYLSLVVNTLQIAQEVQCLQFLVRPAINWFRKQWEYIWNRQRFKLSLPRLHEQAITEAFRLSYANDLEELKSLILVTLPTLGINNEARVIKIIKSIST